jgi:CBS domain-containing protein
VKVSELALRQPITVEGDATVVETAELMASAGVGSVIVVDGETPVGIVTDRDIVTRGVARGYPGDGRIDGLMSMGLIAVEADDEVEDLTHVFRDHAIRRVPIVDHDRIVGLVSLDDVLVFTIETLTDVSTVLAGQIMFPHAADEAQTPATTD